MKNKQEGKDMGLLGWLTVLFVGLKLTNFITWSWVWVLAPLWGGLSIWFIFVVLAAFFTVLAKR